MKRIYFIILLVMTTSMPSWALKKNAKINRGNLVFEITVDGGDGMPYLTVVGLKDNDYTGDVEIPERLEADSHWGDDGQLVRDTLPVKKIQDKAFYECQITRVSLPKTLTHIGESAFSHCKLTEIQIPDNVTHIGNRAFTSNTMLTTAKLSSGLTCVPQALFGYCQNLESIVIPESVTEIQEYAFQYCRQLKEIEISPAVKSIGDYCFVGCRSLGTVWLHEGLQEIGDCAFGECESLTEISMPSSVKSIGADAFGRDPRMASIRKCAKLEKITLNDGLQRIGDHAFRGCESLKELTIPASVIEIGMGIVAECNGLTEIHVDENNWVYSSKGGHNVIMEKVSKTLIAGCNTSIIPEGVERLQKGAFWNCNSLAELKLPESLRTIQENAIYNCPNLSELHIPGNVEEITPSGPDGSFFDTNRFQRITVDPNNDWYDSRGNCNALIRTKDNVLMVGTNNTAIPEGIVEIAAYAFSNRDDLTHITIPGSVEKIGQFAFAECINLREMTNLAETPQELEYLTFMANNPNKIIENMTLHVKKGCRDKYKQAPYWARAKSIWEDAEDPSDISVANEDNGLSTTIYDLQGRQLKQKPSKGLYIQGGKVVIK